ncbi:hypothetical protein KXD40_002888 [Peronospora effusa]|uniref:Uncharacterized protein n=1 Tax=Peronospora effusa TaxID=542832 RepID=A0A3M6VSJ0_9STRA|nr:hypothetical protein DD238_004624 [Peronospora effusa]RQM11787.1 hypothetical protein DD237_005344 [Peronospora effusa]UIZ29955.1 hypothetical protein KXD40_002888 [Peronospora effusa]
MDCRTSHNCSARSAATISDVKHEDNSDASSEVHNPSHGAFRAAKLNVLRSDPEKTGADTPVPYRFLDDVQ